MSDTAAEGAPGPAPARRPATLEEVARRAGVSRSVASRAMNNVRNVSPAKREAVARAAHELGYSPNPTARALRTRTAGSVVLAVSHDDPTLFGDPFFSQVLVGVAAALERSELDLTLLLASSAQGKARLERLLTSRRSDGVMLMALRRDDPLAEVAASTDLPVVIGGRPLDGQARWYVDVDNRGGARQAAEHLLASGRTRLATIVGPDDLQASVARHQGFTDALVTAGLPTDRVQRADFSAEGGARAMARLLADFPDVDGVFAASDNMAAGALRALRAAGRRVPQDVAVVGFDDLEIARHTEPELTTVRQPIRGLGQEMAAMLVRLIDGDSPTPVVLPTELVVRGSAPGGS
ncbi:LacI family DNA-binding transcriptional regulator [Cellulomonas sp. JH27-2]|uniref:LacI family DNA-binding transcriptional regulator n=1 Tax=Cellulomonas sp. JH27-2 TaxID=2774139 RepID=UPI001785D32F|nr:LacI family DNA-binding transcriptional regulator [Cellulomonas sp. JH27-2]MBD8057541.1 LacI family DNA-binding transcriptional regulator [Cellulomonas sp. JH27-2]